MTVAGTQRSGRTRLAAVAGIVLAPTATLALDASQPPPMRGNSIETPSLMLGGRIVCTGSSCDASSLGGYLNAAMAQGAPVRLPYSNCRIKVTLVAPACGGLGGGGTRRARIRVSCNTNGR